MGIFSTNINEIQDGGLISASHIENVYELLSGSLHEDYVLSGSVTISDDTQLTFNSSSGNYTFISSSTTISSSIESVDVLNYINVSGSLSATSLNVLIETGSLPTTDPNVNGQLWRSGSFMMISIGTGSI